MKQLNIFDNTIDVLDFTFVLHDPYDHNVIWGALHALGADVSEDKNIVFLKPKNDEPISEIHVQSSSVFVAHILRKLDACHLVQCQYREDLGFLEFFINVADIDFEVLQNAHKYYENLQDEWWRAYLALEDEGIQLAPINELIEANIAA